MRNSDNRRFAPLRDAPPHPTAFRTSPQRTSHSFVNLPRAAQRVATLRPTALHCSQHHVSMSRSETHQPFVNQFTGVTLHSASFRHASLHASTLRFLLPIYPLRIVPRLGAPSRAASHRFSTHQPNIQSISFGNFASVTYRLARHLAAARRSAPRRSTTSRGATQHTSQHNQGTGS